MGSDWEDLMSGVFGSGGKLNFAAAEGRDRAKQARMPWPRRKKSWKPPWNAREAQRLRRTR